MRGAKAAACLSYKAGSFNVFADQWCIHQYDAARKSKGLVLFPHTLNISREIWILFSPKYNYEGSEAGYLSRIWCVFELATFLKLHARNPKIKLLDIQLLGNIEIFNVLFGERVLLRARAKLGCTARY